MQKGDDASKTGGQSTDQGIDQQVVNVGFDSDTPITGEVSGSTDVLGDAGEVNVGVGNSDMGGQDKGSETNSGGSVVADETNLD